VRDANGPAVLGGGVWSAAGGIAWRWWLSVARVRGPVACLGRDDEQGRGSRGLKPCTPTAAYVCFEGETGGVAPVEVGDWPVEVGGMA